MTASLQTDEVHAWPEFIKDYSFVMSGAHRKPAYELGAPSLSWHTAFWQPDSEDPVYSGCSGSLERRANWIRAIEELILHVYDGLIDHNMMGNWNMPTLTNFQPCTDDKYLRLLRNYYPKDRSEQNLSRYKPVTGHRLPETRYETVHINGVWNSLPMDIRFEVSGEFFTITVTIDFSRMRPQPADPHFEKRRRRHENEFDLSNDFYAATAGHLYEVIGIVNRRYVEMEQVRKRETHVRLRGRSRIYPYTESPGSSKDHSTQALKPHSHYLYVNVWSEMQRQIFHVDPEILKKNRRHEDMYGMPDPNLMKRIGRCFADFRNIALQCELDGSGLFNPWRIENGVFIETARPESSLRKSIEGHRFEEDAIDWANSIHPVLLSAENDKLNHYADESKTPLACDPVEYSFTRFCDRRCIYGSGFGPILDDEKADYDPLTYILLFGFDDPREMGRHLLREHTLGVFRLAALHSLKEVKQKFDHQIKDLTRKLADLQDDISYAFDATYGTEGAPARRRKLKSLRETIHNSIASIHKGLVDLDNEGLISYSVARSKLYRERFEELAKALDSQPIQGYQPFEVFIQHRLARAYSMFQFTGTRHKLLIEKEQRLRNEWMSLNSEQHQMEIEAIQSAAEVLFFAVLLPYYTSHLVISALESKSRSAEWIIQNLHLSVVNGDVDNFRCVVVCLLLPLIAFLVRPEPLKAFLRDLGESIGYQLGSLIWKFRSGRQRDSDVSSTSIIHVSRSIEGG